VTRRDRGCTLVITNWRDMAHPRAGGAEVVCEELGLYLASRGWDVVFLTSAAKGRPAAEVRGRVRFVRRGGTFSVYLWALWWLVRHRRQVGAVIDSQNGLPFYTPLAVRRRTPVLLLVHHVHQDQFAMHMGPVRASLGRFLEGPLTRLVYRRRAVLAVSATTRQQVRQRLGLRGEVTVAPPGTRPAPADTKTRRSPHETIVCVGRLVPHKQLDLVVAAMPELLAEFPRLHLHLVGDGPSRPALERQVDALGLGQAVTVHGALPADERDRLVSMAWMAVHVSAAEGWGLAVVEANSFGVPVLGLRSPGLRDSVRHGENGWLIDDPAELAPAVAASLRVLSAEATAGRWAGRARAWAGRFSWEEMGERARRALLAEQGRLDNAKRERRLASDVSTLVHFPASLAPRALSTRFRISDQVYEADNGSLVLLRGADTEVARTAVARAGLPPLVVSSPSVAYAVARPSDLVAPVVPGTRERVVA
jgi:glycosyltransferase involved in cell wall biosynthesis